MLKPGGLGKGLDALLPISENKLPEGTAAGAQTVLLLEKIKANPNQPRKTFNEDALSELAETIKKNGVLQPIIVEDNGSGEYTVVAGERRLRAARLAGLNEIPAVIKKWTPEESFLASIVENLQREDLNPVEEAAAFKQLMEITGLNQDGVAAKVGKNRATVANALRLLKLEDEIQDALKDGIISAGHARALLAIEDTILRLALFRETVDSGLSVRETEKRASGLNRVSGGEEKERGVQKNSGRNFEGPKRDVEFEALEEKFIKALGTKVKISGTMEGGAITIDYYSKAELEVLYDKLTGENDGGGIVGEAGGGIVDGAGGGVSGAGVEGGGVDGGGETGDE